MLMVIRNSDKEDFGMSRDKVVAVADASLTEDSNWKNGKQMELRWVRMRLKGRNDKTQYWN